MAGASTEAAAAAVDEAAAAAGYIGCAERATSVLLLAAVYCIWFVCTDAHKSDGRVWGSTRFARGLGAVCATLLNLVGVTSTIVFTDDGLSGQCIGAGSPHGAFPLTFVGIGMFLFRLDPMLRTVRLRNAGASVLFYIPLLRDSGSVRRVKVRGAYCGSGSSTGSPAAGAVELAVDTERFVGGDVSCESERSVLCRVVMLTLALRVCGVSGGMGTNCALTVTC